VASSNDPNPKVAVIGGGLIGLSAAWRLAQRGAQVEVFDCEEPGAASSAAAGMLSVIGEAPASPDLDRAFRRSRSLWPDFAKELEAASGCRIDLRETGAILVALGREEEARLEGVAHAHPGVRELGEDERRRLAPGLSPSVRGAFFAPEDAQVDNRSVLDALGVALARKGVVCHREHVVRLEFGERCRILTQRGRFEANRVLVAGGVWTGQILAASGLGACLPKGRPVKGQMIAFEGGPGSEPLRCVVRGPDVYLVPRSGNRLLVGATSEDAGFDCSVTEASVEDLLARAVEIVPELARFRVAEAWAGLRPHLEGEMPVIGPGPAPGLCIATGHYRNGVLMTPLTATLVAGAMLGSVAPEDQTLLRAFALPSAAAVVRSAAPQSTVA
jgi:glycine oxidase